MDKRSKVEIDLCVNNILGAINTRLLKAYADLHPLIPQAGVLIKLWAKKQKLIQTSRFSSYALILMLIHFL